MAEADFQATNGGAHINLPGVSESKPSIFELSKSETKNTMISDSETDMDDCSKPTEKAGEYVRELLQEKQSLDSSQWPNALRLLDQEVTREVARVQATGKPLPKESKYVDIYREKPIRVAVKVLVPIKEHPKFNFVGKLLGPKGNSMKRLQEDTMTKMAVLGRGSMKDKQKEEDLRASLDPKYSHLSDDLHVEIAAFAPPAEAHARIAYALAEVRKYLIPDSNDEIRQEQMREMEMIQTVTSDSPTGSNGTQSAARKAASSNMTIRGRGGVYMRGRGLLTAQSVLPPPMPFPHPVGSSFSSLGSPYSDSFSSQVRGGPRGRMPIRGVTGLRGGMPPMRSTGRGLLSPPAPRGGRKVPPQALLPRPTPQKTKVLSILDKARVAMEESYGYEEEMAGGGASGGFYESSQYDSYNTTGYSGGGGGGYDDFEDNSGDYYETSETYPDEAGNRWKGGFKATAVVGTDRTRYRPAPYTRPTK